MTAVLERGRVARTESIAPPLVASFGTAADLVALHVGSHLVIDLDPQGAHALVIQAMPSDRIALEGALFAGSGNATSSSLPLIIHHRPRTAPWAEPSDAALESGRSDDRPKTRAQSAVAELRKLSGLTMEEIAPLMGVSRRSLQAWWAGDGIGARKEHRLCALRDAIRELAATAPDETRRRLFERRAGNVRPYDLLAEGRLEDAVRAAIGLRSPAEDCAEKTEDDGVLAHLNRYEAPIKAAPVPLNRRFSGPLKR